MTPKNTQYTLTALSTSIMKKSIQRESSRGMLFIRLIELQSKLFWHPPLSPTITETCCVLDKCELSLENHLYNIKKGVREKENKKKTEMSRMYPQC